MITLVLPDLGEGGTERVFLNLARWLAEHGHEVELVVGVAEGPRVAEVPDGVRLRVLGARRMSGAIPGLIRYLRAQRPSALLSGLPHVNVAVLVAARLARGGARVVVSEHKHLSSAMADSTLTRERALPALMRRLYPGAHAIVAVSEGVADDLARALALPRERIVVIDNPVVDDALFAAAREPVEHPWFGEAHVPVLVTAGRLERQKDLPTLLRAVELIHRRRAVRLLVLGEGEERGRLERLVVELGLEDVVDLAGFVPSPYAYIARADVFALSSAYEGSGAVLVEALALGTPVVATDCPSGPAEILAGGRYGRLVPVGHPAAMARAISAVLDDPAPPPGLAAWERFQVDVSGPRYERLLLGDGAGRTRG